MTLYKSPQGEVLDIPAKGIRAIESLGWKPAAPAEDKEPEDKPKPRKRRKSE